jgi:hypothetical protein
MQFQEYPKALYPAGDEKAEPVIVKNKEEEDAQRAAGFRGIGEPEPKAKK